MNENKLYSTRRRNYSNKSDPNIDVQAESLLENDNNVKETSFIQKVKIDNGNKFQSSLKKIFVSKLKFKKKNLNESVDDSFEDNQIIDQTQQYSNKPLGKNYNHFYCII